MSQTFLLPFPSMTALSVVVPATDQPRTLSACTTAIHRALDTGELLVVDAPPGLSASAARNAGARRATGDVVVFVDADVEVRPDALARIRAAFAACPELTAVFGSYDDAPPAAAGTVSAFRNLLHHHVHQGAGGPAETFWSGLGAVRRDAFDAVGGFDAERFAHPSVEDIDLGMRLAAAGELIQLDPAIQGTHLKVWTLRSMVWTDFARRGVPWVALQLRAGRVSSALNLGWRHRVSALVTAAGAMGLLARCPGAAAAALLVLVGLNREFYALLARTRGWRVAALGVGLHALHHFTAVASVPAGVLAQLREPVCA